MISTVEKLKRCIKKLWTGLFKDCDTGSFTLALFSSTLSRRLLICSLKVITRQAKDHQPPSRMSTCISLDRDRSRKIMGNRTHPSPALFSLRARRYARRQVSLPSRLVSYGRKSKNILRDRTFFFFPSLDAQKINSRDSNEQNNDTDTDDNCNHVVLANTRSLLGPTRDPHSSACRFLSTTGVRFSWQCSWWGEEVCKLFIKK